jgi:mannose-6-phosphate isomerase
LSSGVLNSVQRLPSMAYEKVWGSPLTEPWFRNPERRNIGEVWFAASDSVPLLVKFLFTSDNLSIQVHPRDEYAAQHHQSPGKTEMWHILRAEPGARIALGFRESISPERLRESALNGEIVDLMNWIPVKAGDTFFTPAGTVHALGKGLVLCEIQQLSDVTYRLYDWGRTGRELHLDHGVAVSDTGCHYGERTLPVECPYFRTSLVEVAGSAMCPAQARNTLYIALEGEGSIAGQPFHTGEAWEAAAGGDSFEITSPAARFLVTSEPGDSSPRPFK